MDLNISGFYPDLPQPQQVAVQNHNAAVTVICRIRRAPVQPVTQQIKGNCDLSIIERRANSSTRSLMSLRSPSIGRAAKQTQSIRPASQTQWQHKRHVSRAGSTTSHSLGSYCVTEQPRRLSKSPTRSSTPLLMRKQASEPSQNLTIFSTVEESQLLVCVPPLNSRQTGLNPRFVQDNLITAEDVPNALKRSNQNFDIYTFDKVINDSAAQYGAQKFYNSVVRPKLSAKKEGLTVILFGPHNVAKLRKESPLLSTVPEQSLAFKTCHDQLSKGQQICYIQILNFYQDQCFDLLRINTASCNSQTAIQQPVRTSSDIAQVFKVAQQNRESIALSLKVSPADWRHRSHLVLRVIPESFVSRQQSIDFVELCGSDLSAETEIASSTRQQQQDKKFASTSFNQISRQLLQLQQRGSVKTESLLTAFAPLQSRVVFCVNVQPQARGRELRHQITALKFSQKIYQALAKKRHQHQVFTKTTESTAHSMDFPEQNLVDLLEKYEAKLQDLKSQEGSQNLQQEISTMKMELQNIRHDLLPQESSQQNCNTEYQRSPQFVQHMMIDSSIASTSKQQVQSDNGFGCYGLPQQQQQVETFQNQVYEELAHLKQSEAILKEQLRQQNDQLHSQSQLIAEYQAQIQQLTQDCAQSQAQLEYQLHALPHERLNKLEEQFIELSENYLRAKEQIVQLKRSESHLQQELSTKQQLKYREMYLEMREVNKDLKRDFANLSDKVKHLTADADDGKENANKAANSQSRQHLLSEIGKILEEYKKKQDWSSAVGHQAIPTSLARQENPKVTFQDLYQDALL